ncbi:hypothetical protein TIFTF001_044649, partial [Ficus carica]
FCEEKFGQNLAAFL